jgi:hypothetical protein
LDSLWFDITSPDDHWTTTIDIISPAFHLFAMMTSWRKAGANMEARSFSEGSLIGP